jgi:hypothetical protein
MSGGGYPDNFSGNIVTSQIVTIAVTGDPQALLPTALATSPTVSVINVAACASDDPITANQKSGDNSGPCVVGPTGTGNQVFRVDATNTSGRTIPCAAPGGWKIVGTAGDKWKVVVLG